MSESPTRILDGMLDALRHDLGTWDKAAQAVVHVDWDKVDLSDPDRTSRLMALLHVFFDGAARLLPRVLACGHYYASEVRIELAGRDTAGELDRFARRIIERQGECAAFFDACFERLGERMALLGKREDEG